MTSSLTTMSGPYASFEVRLRPWHPSFPNFDELLPCIKASRKMSYHKLENIVGPLIALWYWNIQKVLIIAAPMVIDKPGLRTALLLWSTLSFVLRIATTRLG